MARKPPPPHPKGAPRTPGSGRKRGTPNRKTVELRELMLALSGDVEYQKKFIKAFRERKLHPSTEIKVWEYAIGKPKELIELSAKVAIDEKLAEDRKVFERLSVKQLEELQRESEALMEKARRLAEAKGLALPEGPIQPNK